ncbi:c-type cytochrome [Granulosicoccus antarcticus]|uniref:Cytochrome c-553I n=1 Tax=Granulosicoccus antarcticus IMCC3135 TaxID=1192854 RepID=A0A2Z2NJH7_9GAMM|nr:cytochrome c [Granulosicoccus antarcticus]ASJ70221.1 Cytochrome c-553I [Granulosicoccus antarcticus IMCC3135]
MNKVQTLALCLFVLSPTFANASEGDVPQYVVEDGKVDKATYNGYRRFHGTCHACHGQDALGSSIAPALVESLKTMDYETFKKTVYEGRQTTDASGAVNAMPSFAIDKNITKHLDDIYRYLSARAADALPPGRPEKIPKKKS